MELASIQSPVSAFVAGLVTSLHCAGMCGPLACWMCPVRGDEDASTTLVCYQATRLFSYSLLGALAGALGALPLGWLHGSFLRYLPWALVIFFIGIALGLDKRVPKSQWASKLLLRVQTKARGQSKLTLAASVGLLTPLMPCGPLYFVAAVAALSGSAVDGLQFMLAFGLGTVPLLWFTHVQFGWLKSKLSPVSIRRVQMTLAAVAALVIGWRLRGTIGFTGPSPTDWACF